MRMQWIGALIMALAALPMQGCPNYVPTIKGYAEAGAQTARDVEDLNLARLKFGLCATPFSAVLRNPEFAGALKDLCIGSSNTTVEELLNEAKQTAKDN